MRRQKTPERRGGKRVGAGPKRIGRANGMTVSVRVQPEIRHWIRENGATPFHRKLLETAYREWQAHKETDQP